MKEAKDNIATRNKRLILKQSDIQQEAHKEE